MWSMKPLWSIVSGLGARAERGSRRHAWERRMWAWDAIFYCLLILALASGLGDLGLYGRPQLAMVLLSAAWGGWYWFMVIGHRRWIQHSRPMLVYVAGAIALAFTLIWIHPAYQMLNFALYVQIFTLLPMRRAVPASILVTGLLMVHGIWREPGQTSAWLISGVVTLAVGLFFALWIDSIINQSEDRQRLIDELEETRKELAAAEREAGTLEERGRLAREIHDTLAQGFISVVAHLEATEGALKPGNETALWHLDQARLTARENLVEARHLVAALRPEILEGSSLAEALKRLTARWSEETGIPATLTVTGEGRPLPQEAQVALLRATQEAFSNVRKHAWAGGVTATLSYMEDVVVLDVQDDGQGFDPDRVAVDDERGFGLRAMRERVEALGGSLLVESGPGDGSTLVVELPTGGAEASKEEEIEAEKERR